MRKIIDTEKLPIKLRHDEPEKSAIRNLDLNEEKRKPDELSIIKI
jgi:antitoxin component of RelBE/YafQ-DinJ toxin-antitoxin module